MEHYSSFCTFEIASLPNVLGHYLRKYGNYVRTVNKHCFFSYTFSINHQEYVGKEYRDLKRMANNSIS